MNLDAKGFDFSVKQALKFLKWKNPKTMNGKIPKTMNGKIPKTAK